MFSINEWLKHCSDFYEQDIDLESRPPTTLNY